MRHLCTAVLCLILTGGCSKRSSPPGPAPGSFKLAGKTVDGGALGSSMYNLSRSPVFRFTFTAPVDRSSVATSLYYKDNSGVAVPYNATYENKDSTVVIQPVSALKNIAK